MTRSAEPVRADGRRLHAASILDLIEHVALRRGSLEIADRGGAEVHTYAELLDRAEGWAHGLRRRGLEPGSRIAAVATTSFDFVISLLAAWKAGAAFVPLPPPHPGRAAAWPSQLSSRLAAARVDAVLQGEKSRLPAVDGARIVEVADLGTEAGSLPAVPDDAEAVIQFSSGTTADARGVVLTHSALAAHAVAHRQRSRLPGGAREHAVSWLPLHHDLGFIGYLVRPMAAGMDLTLAPTASFVRDPVVWLRMVSARRATHSSAPNFAFALVARALRGGIKEDLDLSHWKQASVGGEPVDPLVLGAFVRETSRFGFEPSALAPGYGLAEATCTVTLPAVGEGYVVDEVTRPSLSSGVAEPWQGQHGGRAAFVSVGRPLDGVGLRICDAEGRVLPDRNVGEIRVAAPFLMSHYLDDESGTSRVLRDGWLRTGDLGYLVDGQLFVTGRSKDVIVIRGQSLFAEDVERVVQDVPGVRPGAVVVLPENQSGEEKMIVAAESKLDGSSARAECRRAVERRVWMETGVKPERVMLLEPGTLPKTSSGKLRRGKASGLIRERKLVELD